jgi:hypothetical protein
MLSSEVTIREGPMINLIFCHLLKSEIHYARPSQAALSNQIIENNA